MPSTSQAQQRFFAGWEHNPEQMHGKRPNMTKQQMSDFASTKRKGLPKRSPRSEAFGGK